MRDVHAYDTYDEQSDYEWDYDAEDRAPRPRVLWGRVISLVVFVLIAFLIGRWSVADDAATDEEVSNLESEVTRLETENADLTQENADLDAALANQDGGGGGSEEPEEPTNQPGEELQPEVVQVREGDTLLEIVDREYTCTEVVNADGETVNLGDFVAAAQSDPDFRPNFLNQGQDIILPTLPEGYACP